MTTSNKAVQQAWIKRNLLLINCGTYENVIRWIPPLIVTKAQIAIALANVAEVLGEVTGKSSNLSQRLYENIVMQIYDL